MKKLVAFMLCCMMLAGSLCAFGEEGVMPCIDCNHTYGTTTVCVGSGLDAGKCREKDVYEEVCDDCGTVVDSWAEYYTVHEGPIHEVNGVDICEACGGRA